MEVETIAKRWGSSLGVILPKSVVNAKKIKENDRVVIEVKNRPLAGEFFGRFKGRITKSAQELKDDARRGWD